MAFMWFTESEGNSGVRPCARRAIVPLVGASCQRRFASIDFFAGEVVPYRHELYIRTPQAEVAQLVEH